MSPNSIPCHYRSTAEGVKGEVCLVATPWARVPCPVNEKHCRACVQQEKPRDRNAVTASIAVSQIGKQKGKEERKKRWPEFLPYIDPREPMGEGAGTELFKILSRLDIKCEGCPGLFRQMNRKGVDWCEENQEQVLASLSREAERRGWAFSEEQAKEFVVTAIKKARELDDPLHVPGREDGKEI